MSRPRRCAGVQRLLFVALFFAALACAPALAADVVVVGHALSDNGDNDGYADTNEIVNLQITVWNVSASALTGVTALLETDDPKIECLTQHMVYVGDLAAGETRFIPGAFAFKVGDVNRTDVYDAFTATFRVVMSSDSTGDLDVVPESLVLELDLDATPGSGPQDYFEGFEAGSLGSFVPMNIDAGKSSLEASDGYRCQYSDPDWVNSHSYGHITDCWVAATPAQADAFFWQVVDGQAGAYHEKSFTGRYSVWMGALETAYVGFEVTTPMASLEALGSGAPIHLGAGRVCEATRTIACTDDGDCPPGESCAGVASELSFKHQVDFVDWRLIGGRYEWNSAMGGAVALQLADDVGNPVGNWIKLYAYTNVYDQQRDDQYSNCYFDPIDDGNTEDDFFDPADPLRVYGPSTLCMPEWIFARLGDTDASFAAENLGNAEGPGLEGETGLGTWVESRFNLQQFRGRSIRIRFISSGIKAGTAETFEDLFKWNPIAGDDGWWIDDVLITDTLAVPAVLSVDAKDNSGLPGVVDGDTDGYCDSDCDDGDPACNTDCSDADSDGQRICNGDCDEGNPDVYLGAAEVCDGVSNDCAHPHWPLVDYWIPTTMDEPPSGANSVHAADLDGDGDGDAVSAWPEDDMIVWHENSSGDGSAWITHVISSTVDRPVAVHAADLDGDTDMDLIASLGSDEKIVWYENTAGDGSAWAERVVARKMTISGSGLMAADVDGDHDPDILITAADSADQVRWFENAAGDGSDWNARTMFGDSWPMAVVGADIDGDEDLDVVHLDNGSWETWWWENTHGDGSSWVAHRIDGVGEVNFQAAAGDLDDDGDQDVLVWNLITEDLNWYENVAGDGSTWILHVIAAQAGDVEQLVVVDMDGDEDMDALAATAEAGRVTWYDNAAGDGSVWIARPVDLEAEGAVSACTGHVNDDGDLDVFSAGAAQVTWYSRANIELDDDGDGIADCAGDCDDTDVTVWGLPGEVQDLTLLEDRQTLVWSAPADPGATSVVYNTLRGETPDGFLGASCVEWGDGSDTEAVDTDAPASGAVYYYLVVAVNGCGTGCAGTTSDEEQREVCACP